MQSSDVILSEVVQVDPEIDENNVILQSQSDICEFYKYDIYYPSYLVVH